MLLFHPTAALGVTYKELWVKRRNARHFTPHLPHRGEFLIFQPKMTQIRFFLRAASSGSPGTAPR